jgi:hypothetical protein
VGRAAMGWRGRWAATMGVVMFVLVATALLAHLRHVK